MSMPKFDETFLPVLQVLADGQIHKFSELPQTLLDRGYFQLTPEELRQTVSDGSGLYYGRVGWGVTYLKQASLRRDLLARLYEVNPYYFQRIVLELFRQMGYGEFIETPRSCDGGIDGIINRDELGLERIYMQAKRYGEGNKVREPEIRNFIGAMSSEVTKGIFVATSDFDSKAIEKAHGDHHHTIILINGSQLAELLIKYHIGVQSKAKYEVLEIDEDYFEGE